MEPGCQLGKSVGLRDTEAALGAFAHAARRQILAAASRAGTLGADAAMSRDMVAWIKAAKAHCAYVVLLNFVDAVAESKPRVSSATAAVMDRLVSLHALATMDDNMGDFLEDGHVSADQAAAIRAEVAVLLAELRPDAAALVDSFALDDYFSTRRWARTTETFTEAVRRGSVGAVQRVARAAGVRGLAALTAHQGRRAK